MSASAAQLSRMADHADAAVVLGQPDAHSEGPQAGGRGPEHGLHLPTGIVVHDGRLVVADAGPVRGAFVVFDESQAPDDELAAAIAASFEFDPA